MRKSIHHLSLTTAVLLLAGGMSSLNAKEDPKYQTGNHNPICDFWYAADPTSVEYNGRLYVYGSNDQQEFDANPLGTENSYGKIRSLAVFSTDDMVNWTFHGTIDMTKVKDGSWIGTSWAPTIVSRQEKDGKTHFYLYFLNSGYAVAVLTATSPLGPWTSPRKSNITNGFDPGVVIDENGVGWLSYGGFGSTPSIVKLTSDMISLSGSPIPLNPPFHNEANELNYINGTYVYTYNTDWSDHTPWTYSGQKPTACSMCYMTSKTPTKASSWTYKNMYFRNQGDYLGFGWNNNHTHIQKFAGEYYLIYHSQMLQEQNGHSGNYRSLSIDKIKVDEQNVVISEGTATRKGVDQIHLLNPYALQQAETTSATKDVKFKADALTPGNMYYAGSTGKTGYIKVSGVDYMVSADSIRFQVWGKGSIDMRLDSESGRLLASCNVDSSQPVTVSVPVKSTSLLKLNLVFVCKDAVNFDTWQFVSNTLSVETPKTMSSGLSYDLNGKVINPSGHQGIYIMDGKKYLAE